MLNRPVRIARAQGRIYAPADHAFAAVALTGDGSAVASVNALLKALRAVRVAEQDHALGGRVRMMTIAGTPVPAAWETGRLNGSRSLRLVAARSATRITAPLRMMGTTISAAGGAL